MISKKYDSTSVFGVIHKDGIRFSDVDLFGAELWKYSVLKKITIWYGTPVGGKEKQVIGIQCKYQQMLTGKKIESPIRSGDLTSGDIEVKQLELKEGDFFTKFNIAFDESIIYLKFTTFKKEVLEVGKIKEDTNKTVDFNDDPEPHVIQCFTGNYNKTSLSALGVKHIKRKDFIIINLWGILRVRHLFLTNVEEKNKWSNKENLNKLEEPLKALAKLCLLPDNQFTSVIKYFV